MRSAPALALLAASAFTLGACSGSGGEGATRPSGVDVNNLGNTGVGKDPTARGPVTIPGAHKGGTVTVLTHLGLTSTLDPSEVYNADTASIMSGLVSRSLTQYRYNPDTHQMVLVPDLATDLGTPNDSFTRWTFTVRPGVKFEDGTPVTANDVAWGIQRCMDVKTFPTGPCQYYANAFFRGGSTYQGPYTAPDQPFKAVEVSGDKLTIFMDRPFPDLPYFGSFPAMGPIPRGKVSDPRTYRDHPLATGPYELASLSPSKELVLRRNPYWDPRTDPARTAYPDGYDFKTQVASERIDQILLANSGSGQTTLTYENLLAPDYQKMQQSAPDRITFGGQPCTFYWAPDNRKITDKRIREALSWAYPYKNVILATGDIPGVTAVPATNLMPPGVPGRTPYNVTGRRGFQTDPAKARALLEQAHATGYEIRFLFRSNDTSSVKVKDALTRALAQAGFTATPVPTTIAGYSTVNDDPSSDINVRVAGWCSDWQSGATWLPPLYASRHPDESEALGANAESFSNPWADQQLAAIQRLPLGQQPDAWNKLDEQIMRRYFPLFPTSYGGVAMAHGSQIQGMNDNSALGMPTWTTMWVGQ